MTKKESVVALTDSFFYENLNMMPLIYIITIVATSANAAAISCFTLGFSFRITLITVENTITPPVIIGYCTDAGNFVKPISAKRFPSPHSTAKPIE